MTKATAAKPDYGVKDRIVETEECSEEFSSPALLEEDVDDAVGTRALEDEERKTLAAQETRAVGIWRVIVYLVVLVVAVTVSLLVYFYTTNDQQQNFETTYAGFASILSESFFDSLERKFQAFSSFSTTITSFAISSGARFPNVTIPHFELRGVHSRIQAAGVIVYWLPLVTDETRAGWEEYAAANRNWIMEAFAAETMWKNYQDEKFGLGAYDEQKPESGNGSRKLQLEGSAPGQVAMEDGYNRQIFYTTNKQPEPKGSGPFLPLWQLTPVVPLLPFMNYNLIAHDAVRANLQAVIDSQKIVIGNSHDLKDPDDTTDVSESMYNAFLVSGQYRHDSETYQGDPSSTFIVPVFDRFDPHNRTIAGVLMASVYWRLGFAGVLPETAKGIICVLENSLNQSFTYRLDGPEVTFLGPGDRHDPKFDDLVVEEDVSKNLALRAGPHNRAFDVADLNQDYCQYQMRIYPSQDTEDEYVNNAPILYTLLVASVFLFTSLVFIAYDWLVARRQSIVMQKAVKSSAIVNTLYPKQVQDRLFNKDDDQEQAKKNAWKTEDLDVFGPGVKRGDRPIADLYEASTILFADLAGFTKWSSTRKPEDVFYLLETIYQAFDKAAARRKVFKVETVGDCYVAATGVPDPQPNHAVIMVKFCRECYSILSKVLPSLAETLGGDTMDLNFRVGLHSGPITGGVLRGQKSRFQLFGDTINTASRMESNGIPGRIHVSQSTADEVKAHGHASWLTEREDKVVAKGKGEMTTYFVSVHRQANSTISGVESRMSHGDDSESFRVVVEPLRASNRDSGDDMSL